MSDHHAMWIGPEAPRCFIYDWSTGRPQEYLLAIDEEGNRQFLPVLGPPRPPSEGGKITPFELSNLIRSGDADTFAAKYWEFMGQHPE